MDIKEFQEWTREFDETTGWELLTTPQLLAHLTEEVGELAQSINRTSEYRGEVRDQHLKNIGVELVDALWFLVKIANRFEVDLSTNLQAFVDRVNAWPPEKHQGKLENGLETLKRDLGRSDTHHGVRSG